MVLPIANRGAVTRESELENLRIMTQTITTQHLSSEAINQLVDDLPDCIKVALLEKSTQHKCSLEAAMEMAISSFLDEESFSFEDCLLAKGLKDQ